MGIVVVTLLALSLLTATSVVGGDVAAAAATSAPYGFVDQLQVTPSGLVGRGWTIDDDAPGTPLMVHVYAGDQFIGAVAADQSRPDVAGAYPHAGEQHGFGFTLPLGEGQHTVCVYAINAGAGAENPRLGCRTLWSQVAYGSLDIAARFPTALRVAGWAADSDTTDSITVTVQVAGAVYGVFPADVPRGDVDAAYGAGPRHGFDLSFPVPPPGTHDVCVTANGVGPGGSQLLGCRAVEISYTQVGYLDTLRAGDTFVRLSGWTFDPDAAEPNHVVVIADGALIMDVAAIRSRPDVGAAYPGAGPDRGFAVDVTLSPGSHSVCAYATGLGPGPEYVLLGCAQVETMPPGTGLGSGRRIVYANGSQWVWLVDGDGIIDSSYPVSGRYRDPPPGEYGVYGKWRNVDAGHDGISMEYFVGFNPAGDGYGFHTIPTYADGTPLQGEDELGQFRSAGCVRQRREDAIHLWNWSVVGDRVVVIA